MSDNLLSTKSQLETLPNELFLEIFQYIDPIDLCRFKHLNKRIGSIVGVTKVNLEVRHHKDDLGYLSSFTSSQIIRLEIRNRRSSLNLNTMVELRSVTLDFMYLSSQQRKQVIEIHLPYLERLTVENIENDLCQALFKVIIIGEHFPLLNMCRLKLGHLHHFKFRAMQSSPNTTLRSLAIDKWHWSELDSLLHQFPHLSRFETNLEKSNNSITNNVQPYLSMRHVRINLNDPANNLKNLLKLTPNLSRLRIRGDLGSDEVTNHFEKMAKCLFQIVPQLQKFDCELYCAAFEKHSKELAINQLHPLFNRVRCLFGPGYNQCYTTDVNIYPVNNEYQKSASDLPFFIPSTARHSYEYHDRHYFDECDDDRYQEDDDDGAWERNEYGNGPNMYWDAESDDWCPLP